MELTKQVVSLAQAKRLKELGVVQESLFCWLENSASRFELMSIENAFEHHIHDYEFSIHPDGFDESFKEQSWSAFTVAELIQALGSVEIELDGQRWYAISKECSPSASSLPWCLAQLLIYRIENNLTTPEEVNNRLTAKDQ